MTTFGVVHDFRRARPGVTDVEQLLAPHDKVPFDHLCFRRKIAQVWQ